MTLHEAIAEAYRVAGHEDPVRAIPKLIREGARKHKNLPLADCTIQEKEGQDRVMLHGRLWIPDCEDLRRRVIEENHDPPLIGHPGNANTYARVRKMFYWPKMNADVKRYVRNCHLCQRSKPSHEPSPQLLPLPVPTQRWEDVTMDFITDLPLARRSVLCKNASSILVVVDHLSKEEHIIPCEKMTADYLANVFVRDVVRLHGLPKSIVTDRGTQFTDLPKWAAQEDLDEDAFARACQTDPSRVFELAGKIVNLAHRMRTENSILNRANDANVTHHAPPQSDSGAES